MLRQDIKKPNQMVILIQLIQFVTLLMVLHQHLVVEITLSVYGMLRQDNKKPNQMAIHQQFIQSISHLMEIHQLLVAMITLSVYGMQNHQRKYINQIVAIKVCLPSLTYHFRIASYCQMLILILQYLEYVRILYLKHQEHLSYKDSSLIIKGKIQNHCLYPKEVSFQKTQSKTEFEYSLQTIQLQFQQLLFFCLNFLIFISQDKQLHVFKQVITPFQFNIIKIQSIS
ncbi:unnamed protein product [Paramecium octaurelia]|uniref:Transmembrane protein n=1 Tax=Paramecium octaurelia TaxID=43137 RepID=A0A8S1YRU4_PAROT|nr:unnamed protein product [Paramecium octaurelia]